MALPTHDRWTAPLLVTGLLVAGPASAGPFRRDQELGDCRSPGLPAPALFDASDCSASSSSPTAIYDPGPTYTIRVVVHVIMDSACSQGVLSDALVTSQIEVLNEDFGALPSTPGAAGADSGIRFELATVDPAGQPTTGITRDCNTTWFNDQTQTSPYYDTLAWDPSRYLNLYTNSAAGARGYFTLEQSRRLRCTIASYRASLVGGIFRDGFETGDTAGWSAVQP